MYASGKRKGRRPGNEATEVVGWLMWLFDNYYSEIMEWLALSVLYFLWIINLLNFCCEYMPPRSLNPRYARVFKVKCNWQYTLFQTSFGTQVSMMYLTCKILIKSNMLATRERTHAGCFQVITIRKIQKWITCTLHDILELSWILWLQLGWS